MNFLQTLLLSSFLMCLAIVPIAIFLHKKKDNPQKPTLSCRKFKRRKKFHKHGQEPFKDSDPNENDKS